jgi:hypothetical protein
MGQKDLLDKVNQLNQMVLEGAALDAFDRFYHDDVIMQENDAVPFVGKSFNREREQKFFSSITEFRGAKVLSVATAGDKTYVEWFFDYTHKEWGSRTYHQVAVQTWKDGKIINEKFYYGTT